MKMGFCAPPFQLISVSTGKSLFYQKTRKNACSSSGHPKERFHKKTWQV